MTFSIERPGFSSEALSKVWSWFSDVGNGVYRSPLCAIPCCRFGLDDSLHVKCSHVAGGESIFPVLIGCGQAVPVRTRERTHSNGSWG